ncbi:hypothetical protein HYPBUDRAFT_151752 [Hyphopichia burtonii NRRL Y-1933]|uniref:Uncharacterized protein n=1 Tax=Hyphopichia burtonii NRRL Y-1933 TaxID=984485 RepID=A0A1E4RT11_9ASCO|nr:hypothetical protein HYPBUDRAFT_151752 [Hyphopichia burtonii NRRL Y-1933]ODV70412.1 hypothetical protein HYPBUDRAFT_151752 [Hyphopichia burtonii NRRL Y-1933]
MSTDSSISKRPFITSYSSTSHKICTQRCDSFPYCTRKGQIRLNMSARSTSILI